MATMREQIQTLVDENGWDDNDVLGYALEFIDGWGSGPVTFVNYLKAAAEEQQATADGLAEAEATKRAAEVCAPRGSGDWDGSGWS
jgi:hypothetical protein